MIMNLWGVFFGSFLIGFSGAIMPGPMLGIVINGSLKKGWKAGPLTVTGHGLLELALVVLMAFGLKDFFSNRTVAGLVGLFGGAFLAWMGYGMIKSGIKKSVSLENQSAGKRTGLDNLILSGALVSITNPYFIIWWSSTGMESVRRSQAFGLMGIIAFFTGHILSDFTWYFAVSAAFSKGKKLLSDRAYRWLIIFLGGFITAFSVYFITGGLRMLH